MSSSPQNQTSLLSQLCSHERSAPQSKTHCDHQRTPTSLMRIFYDREMQSNCVIQPNPNLSSSRSRGLRIRSLPSSADHPDFPHKSAQRRGPILCATGQVLFHVAIPLTATTIGHVQTSLTSSPEHPIMIRTVSESLHDLLEAAFILLHSSAARHAFAVSLHGNKIAFIKVDLICRRAIVEWTS